MVKRIERLFVAGVCVLAGTACGPQGDVDWVYADGEVRLDLDVRQADVPTLSVVAEGRAVRGEGEGCFDANELVGASRQRLRRDIFGDLDFADWGNSITMCGPVEWDLGDGVRQLQMQLEYNVGQDGWFWANMWMPDGGGSLDMWMNRPNESVDGSMAEGSASAPVWISGWGEQGRSPCPQGREWCELRGDLTLTWSFSDEYVEQQAW